MNNNQENGTIETTEVFSAQLEGEESCLLTDIVCVKNEIILIDNYNKKLKRFTCRKEFVDILTLSDPFGVASLMLSSHVVVTEPHDRSISFVIMEGHLALSSRRKTSKPYKSVCVIDETRMAVVCCETGESCVDIIDYMGTILLHVEYKANHEKIFMTPVSMCHVRDRGILVSDSGLGKLIILTPEGVFDSTYDPKCSPGGVTVDASGFIYLCLQDKRSVQYLTFGDKLEPVRTFSIQCLSKPFAITTSKTNLVMIGDDDVVALFKVTIILIQICNLKYSRYIIYCGPYCLPNKHCNLRHNIIILINYYLKLLKIKVGRT